MRLQKFSEAPSCFYVVFGARKKDICMLCGKLCRADAVLYKFLYRVLGFDGVKCAVFHCDYMRDSELSYEEKLRKNISQLKKLAELIAHIDITVCIENCCGMSKSIDDILFMLDCLRNPKFAICLDTGHLNVSKAESHREFILKAGDKLRALHIADNDGTDDQHVMPFCSGSVNFVEVVKALSEIGYDGLFNYEIPGECNMNPVPFELLHEKVKYIKSGYSYLMKFI